MFDTAWVKVGDTSIEIQFKLYLGDYEPQCNHIVIGQSLPLFPKIPRLECSGTMNREDDCRLVFIEGVLTNVIYPIPADHVMIDYLPLRKGVRELRKSKIQAEYNRRLSSTDTDIASGMCDFLRSQSMRIGFMRRVVSQRSRGGNHIRVNNKWVRVTKY
jgi:hypothetical protein